MSVYTVGVGKLRKESKSVWFFLHASLEIKIAIALTNVILLFHERSQDVWVPEADCSNGTQEW